ncbi:gamma-glutamyltransferase [Nisaea nitritireducens]|uniref:gamma-glutamyltransferase n=1 Tax=Nisaea nitritireducens TaxID=568392 RepID=UPI00186831D3|nr:gamma-glutamyltransferase [Nisaea nitritireducens]
MFKRTVPVALALCAGLLAGCASDEAIEVTEGFFGSVAVDEPRAALIAQDVLVQGGTAADAAVSAYFTLAVTLPSSAGLGAGGSCLAFDPVSKRFERLSFPPQPLSDERNAIAAPVGPRAMFALHARYGRLPITQLIGVPEQLARFGEPVSRRLAEDLARDGAVLTSSAAGRSVLLAPDGAALQAGRSLVQLDLASAFGRLRVAGIGDLYSGQLARRFVTGAESFGYKVDPARLRRAAPAWSNVEGVDFDNHVWAVAASRSADSALIAKTLSLAFHEAGWSSSPQDIDPLMLAEMQVRAANAVAKGDIDLSADAAERLFGNFRSGIPRTAATPAATALFGGKSQSGATSFTITDRRGLSVGCALTLNAPFGIGQMLPNLGFIPAPALPTSNPPLAAAVIAGNTHAWQVHITAMATGGRETVSALVPSILRHYVAGQAMSAAVAAPRSHFDLAAGTLSVESGIAPAAGALASRAGYPVQPASQPIGAVRLFRCKEGLPRSDRDCGIADDPRGRGMILFEGGN